MTGEHQNEKKYLKKYRDNQKRFIKDTIILFVVAHFSQEFLLTSAAFLMSFPSLNPRLG